MSINKNTVKVFPFLTGEHSFLPPSNTPNRNISYHAPQIVSDVLNSVFNDKPCKLNKLVDLESSFSDWVARNAVYPPSEDSLKESFRSCLIKGEDINILWCLCHLYPEITKLSIDEVKKNKTLVDEKSKIIINTYSTPKIESTEKEKSFNKNKNEVDAPKKEMSEWFLKTINYCLEASPAQSVRRELFDDAIKRDVVDKKGTGPSALGYWFHDFGFHGLCGLNEKELNTVNELWPKHNKIRHQHPSSMLGDRVFWSSLKSMPTKDRRFLIDKIMPELIDQSDWSLSEMRSVLKSMVQRTEKYGWLFLERVKLWQSLGGDLDQKFEEAPALSAFDAPKMSSMREWINSSGNDVWIKELENVPVKNKQPKP